ncbi:hypothetical protein U8527_03555 [Kordia algicida OT-1]|uniref:Uncharacterized protein n=1 Tax=Kordia algicida OT-1 TaxID=391587 RepID=A9DPB5_9FLAO|nr:hypothetical protein [Kordia algicida]EDP97396.1 hypothetical protein KAOT1_19577 [Kordia algicida OT-1]
MDYLHKEKFVETFEMYICDCYGPEGWYHDKQTSTACFRIRATFEDLISKGFTKYDAIFVLCKQVNITFEILLKLDYEITIKTFMNGKEWKASTFNGNRFDASEILASRLSELLYVRFQNIIFIEDASK